MPEPLAATDVSAILEGKPCLKTLSGNAAPSSASSATEALPVSHPDLPPHTVAAPQTEENAPKPTPSSPEGGDSKHKNREDLPIIKIKL